MQSQSHSSESSLRSLSRSAQEISFSAERFFHDPLSRMIIEGTHDCITLLDPAGLLLYMNYGGQRAMEIDDFSRYAQSDWSSLWSDNAGSLSAEAIASAQQGHVSTFEGSCLTTKGTLKWWNVTVSPVFDEQRQVTQLLTISHDITDHHQLMEERQRALEPLRLELLRYGDIFDYLPVGIVIAEAQTGKILLSNQYENQIALYLTHMPSALPEYATWAGWHPDGTRIEDSEWPLARALRGETYTEEISCVRDDGVLCFLNVNVAPLCDVNGNVIAGMVAVSDITEQKNLERQQQAFISLATHELKGPLTALQGNIQLAQRRLHWIVDRETQSESEKQKIIDEIQSFLLRCQYQMRLQNRLINDLLDMSRIQNDQLELHIETCNIIELLEEITFEHRMVNAQRTIFLDFPQVSTLLVRADRDRIGQVLNNYMTNALKYSPTDHPVTMGFSRDDELVRVWVRDTGPGLSQDAQQHIWRRFYQVPNITVQTPVVGSRGVGLGLGLYICQNIIQRHGGQVGVESEQGQGATFWLTLPLYKPAPDETS